MSLDVYLYGELLGGLERAEGGYELAYLPEAVARYGPGASLLSVSLPAREEPFSPRTTRAFVEGLLPQGMRRLRLARELGIEPDDGYALIAAIGRDCAGAAVFLPAGAGAAVMNGGPPTGPANPTPVSEAELEELVAAPPPRLFDPDRPQRMRAALPGLRHKLSLLRSAGGAGWAWPEPGLPSTHIVKPESGEHDEMVANEMFCTAVLVEAGLPVAPASVETIAGRRCFVSERFDRVGRHPEVSRFHQESFCQALGFEPDADEDSEEAAGPGFAEASGLLRATGQEERIPDLLVAALCGYILGNGDLHGENFALVASADGPLLAPFYDVLSSAVYDDPTFLGMTIAEDYDESAYLYELALICEEVDIDFERCRGLAASVATRMTKALPLVATRAREEGWHAPVIDGILDLAAERAVNLGYEVQY